MPEHVSTDSTEVAMILAAAELTKLLGPDTPSKMGADYRQIYEAIWKAKQEEYKGAQAT